MRKLITNSLSALGLTLCCSTVCCANAFAQANPVTPKHESAIDQATQSSAADASVDRSAALERPTDMEIRDAVEDQLLVDLHVPLHRLDVTVSEGIVTLEGRVENVLARDRAARIAETLRGVRSVINRVEVEPLTERTDKQLYDDIEAALLRDPATESYEVKTAVTGGFVTLEGIVDSEHERQFAAKVAKGVAGVRDVENKLAVRDPVSRPDLEIQNDIEQALAWNVLVQGGLVDVEVDQGVATLTGSVGSAAERRLVERMAWVAGVSAVKSEALEVAPWLERDRQRDFEFVIRSDDEIATAIRAALVRDPRVSADSVKLDVAASAVTLRGSVPTLRASNAAETAARHTAGVLLVQNRLRVVPPTETAVTTIQSEMETALLLDPYLNRYEVEHTFHDGEMRLTGRVDSYFERAQAGVLAASVPGVEAVDNRLRVVRDEPAIGPDPFVDPWLPTVDSGQWLAPVANFPILRERDLWRRVENQIKWSPFIDREAVDVMVNGGTVTLTGQVHSTFERDAAIRNAFEAGALSVHDNLLVDDRRSASDADGQ